MCNCSEHIQRLSVQIEKLSAALSALVPESSAHTAIAQHNTRPEDTAKARKKTMLKGYADKELAAYPLLYQQFINKIEN